MRVGYIRVSAVDQNTVRQLDGIAVDRTFVDKVSGKDTARPQLGELLVVPCDPERDAEVIAMATGGLAHGMLQGFGTTQTAIGLLDHLLDLVLGAESDRVDSTQH